MHSEYIPGIIYTIIAAFLVIGYGFIKVNNRIMYTDPSVDKIYSANNTFAILAICASIGFESSTIFLKEKLINSYITVSIILYGYYILWTNTTKMQSDPNATKYYQKNKNALLLISIPLSIYILFIIWSNFNSKPNNVEKTIYDL
jgi:hypothetical protein